MIKFYTEISLITPENRKRIFPLLLDIFFLKNKALEHFQCVESIEKAQVCIFPLDISYPKSSIESNILKRFINYARNENKKVWVYSGGDFGRTISNEVIIFRLGGFNSKLNLSTNILPSFINDPYKSIFNKAWNPLDKNEYPTIGFVGNADGSILKWGKELFIYCKQTLKRLIKIDYTDNQFFFPSSIRRFQLLERMRKEDKIYTDFIYRKKYRAGVKKEFDKIKSTIEFYENIERNLYTFCLRGSGNFSVRFYETLIVGRIPILIDTDVRLPLHTEINWSNHCIICSENNFIEKIIDFHNSHTNDELKNIQYQNRYFALNQLNRLNYFKLVSKKL